MSQIYTKFCDMCGMDFKSLSPFAQICSSCKKVKFKKLRPFSIKDFEDVVLPNVKVVDMIKYN